LIEFTRDSFFLRFFSPPSLVSLTSSHWSVLANLHEFAALQTGNVAVSKGEGHVWEEIGEHAAVLFSNFAGVVLFCAITYACKQACCKRPLLLIAFVICGLTAGGAAMDMALHGNSWAACLVSASFGAMNFMSSPNSDLGGKLFAMTSLTTGNLQKLAKMFFRCMIGNEFTPQDKQATYTALTTVLATMIGALLGGLALYAQPFGTDEKESVWLVLVAILQLWTVIYHDVVLRPQDAPAEDRFIPGNVECTTPSSENP